MCNNSQVDHCHDEELYFSSSVLLVIVVFSLVIGLLTGAGNSLVVASVYIFRSLRTHSNYFLVSLALADLSVGLVAIPLYCIGAITWPHTIGTTVGQALDFTMVLSLTASSLNLVAVSYDRHLAISSPLRYCSLMSLRRCRAIIILVWIFSVVMAFPGFAAKDFRSRSILNVVFIVISFVFPLVVLIVVQFNIFKAVRHQLSFIKDPMLKLYVKNEDFSQYRKGQGEESQEIEHQDKELLEVKMDACEQRQEETNPNSICKDEEHRLRSCKDVLQIEENSKQHNYKGNQDFRSLKWFIGRFRSHQRRHLIQRLDNKAYNNCKESRIMPMLLKQEDVLQVRFHQNHHRQPASEHPHHSLILMKQLLKDNKHAITLALVIGCFTLCWLPTCVLIVLQATDKDVCNIIKHEQIYFVTLLIALGNSLLNPFIYCARLNAFRKAFIKILKCKCQSSATQ